MNAGPQSIVSLLTSANQRMVIPVYQRAYSWDEEQCRQLWDDIVAVGRRNSGTHFTGSVVMVLGGEFSASGVKVAEGKVAGSKTFNLGRGIYIIKVGDTVKKIAVK